MFFIRQTLMEDHLLKANLGRSDALPPISAENAHTYEFIPSPAPTPIPKPKLQTVKTNSRKERVGLHCPGIKMFYVVLPQVNVYIKIKFVKIGDINTAQEMFKATAFFQARWLEPALDQHSKKVYTIIRGILV